MTRELLLVRGLSKAFKEQGGIGRTIASNLVGFVRAPNRYFIFRDVDFTLRSGECVALTGGNGSGKSTFLRCLAGVLKPTSGEVLQIGRLTALLSHGFGAYEDLPVRRNMVLVQQILGATLAEAEERLARVAATAELAERLYSPTSHLSEGMRAKVALSALAHTPFQVALLDESLNHVDAEFREIYFQLTRKWLSEGRSLVMTSHDDGLLKKFGTRSLRFRDLGLHEAM